MNKLTSDNTRHIFQNLEQVIPYIANVIKKYYFDDTFLKYKEFTVDIKTINELQINNTVIGTMIKCNQLAIDSCAFIKQQSQSNKTFAVNMQTELRTYFNNSKLEFIVLNATKIQTNCIHSNVHSVK